MDMLQRSCQTFQESIRADVPRIFLAGDFVGVSFTF